MSELAPSTNALKRFAVDHPLWLVFSLALGVRFANILAIPFSGGEFLIEDSTLYPVIAQEWMKSLGLLAGEPGEIGYEERTPLYPVFVGIMQLLGLDRPLHLVLVNSLFDAGTCVLVAMLGGMLDRWTGLTAGLLAAFWPNLIIHSGIVLTDTMFLFLMTGVILAVARFTTDPTGRRAGIIGLLLGLAILTRAIAQFLPIPISIVLFIAARRAGCSWRQATFAALIQLLVVAVLVVPIQLHNKDRFGGYSLTSQAGTHLLYWIVPAVHEIEFGTPKAEGAALMLGKLTERLAKRGVTPEQMGSFEVSREQTKLAFDVLSNSSASAIAQAWLNGFVLNLAAPAILIDPRVRSLSPQSFYDLTAEDIFGKIKQYLSGNGVLYSFIFAAGALGSFATLIAAILGFFRLSREHKAAAVVAFLILLYFLAINGPV
ncbi:MAG: glycosyltransferase family 39 protein, partial [Pseudomonadota bacterium]|nr:glycosyltransferase family 39 protein [Pseudomonadota bacterium]